MDLVAIKFYRWISIFGFFLLALGGSARGFAKNETREDVKTQLVSVTEIEDRSDDALTHISVGLSGTPEWKKISIENHRSFLQIPLPGAVVLESGRFMDIESPYIEKMVSFQTSPQDAAIRLFLAQDSPRIAKSVHADIIGQRLEVTLDHARVSETSGVSNQAAQTVPIEHGENPAASPKNPASGVIATESNSESQDMQRTDPEPQGLKKYLLGSGLGFRSLSDDPKFRDRMNGVALFIMIMAAGILALYVLRPKLMQWSHPKLSNRDDWLQMRTMVTHSLSPKQKLAVVQVGQEQILLGVTSDHIQYIKTLDGPNVGIHSATGAQGLPPLQMRKIASPSRAQGTQNTSTLPQPPRLAARSGRELEPRRPDHSPPSSAGQIAYKKSTSPNSSQASSGLRQKPPAHGKSHQSAGQNGNAPRAQPENTAKAPSEAISDVTKLIREKLNQLPKIEG